MEPVEPAPETFEDILNESGERLIICPWCDSREVEMVSEYGPHLMVSQYICLNKSCRSPFEVIRR